MGVIAAKAAARKAKVLPNIEPPLAWLAAAPRMAASPTQTNAARLHRRDEV
jgi:hypothetical protein